MEKFIFLDLLSVVLLLATSRCLTIIFLATLLLPNCRLISMWSRPFRLFFSGVVLHELSLSSFGVASALRSKAITSKVSRVRVVAKLDYCCVVIGQPPSLGN